MPNPLSANSLEMQARYRPHRRGDRIPGAANMEVAMAATLFRDLKEAGYLPEDAELADHPPCKSDSVDGGSYEAILVELITDKDRDGKLDIDLDELVMSGMLKDTGVCITGAALIDSLEGKREGLSDAFLREQNSSSDLSYCDIFCIGEDIISDKGREVQDFSQNMVLSRNVETEIDRVAGNIEALGGAKVAQDTILQAQLLRQKGDASSSRRLLSGTMDELIAANEWDAAETIAAEFQSAALADEEVSTVVDHQLGWRTSRGSVGHLADGNTTYIRPNKFNSTLGEVGTRRMAQIDMARTMADAVSLPEGVKFDAYNPEHVTLYLQSKVDGGASTEDIAEAYRGYLDSFYSHSKKSVTWNDDIALDDRAENIPALMGNQPRELGGRKIVDCEGFAFLTEKIMGDLKDSEGAALMDVRYMATSTHIIAGAVAKDGSGGFSVNNTTVTDIAAQEGGYSEDDISTHMRADIDSESRYKIKFGQTASSCSFL